MGPLPVFFCTHQAYTRPGVSPGGSHWAAFLLHRRSALSWRADQGIYAFSPQLALRLKSATGCRGGGMVDTADLKSAVPPWACGFESHPRHQFHISDAYTSSRMADNPNRSWFQRRADAIVDHAGGIVVAALVLKGFG